MTLLINPAPHGSPGLELGNITQAFDDRAALAKVAELEQTLAHVEGGES